MFRLLDFTTPLEEYREHVATLQCAALWFLGDCVDFLKITRNIYNWSTFITRT